MAVHETALRRRATVAEGTAAFYFDRPAGFVHQAGQNALESLGISENDMRSEEFYGY